MNHKEILTHATNILQDRGHLYGNVDDLHNDISIICSVLLGKNISSYDIAMVHVATKLVRMKNTRTHKDNYVDAVNYLTFAAQFADQPDSIAVGLEDKIYAVAQDLKKV